MYTKGERYIKQLNGHVNVCVNGVVVAESFGDIANAHLVKAAPAMYETLKALLEHLTMPKGELGRPYMADVKRMAYKALASAEGE